MAEMKDDASGIGAAGAYDSPEVEHMPLADVELQDLGDEGKSEVVEGEEPPLDARLLAFGGVSTIPQASFNFINSIVGAGIIGLPFAVKEAGFGLGLCLLVGCGLLTDFSVRILIQTSAKHKQYNYEEICQYTFGKFGFYLVSAFMWVFAFGAMIAYFVIIGDTITSVLTTCSIPAPPREAIIIGCAVFIILPLSSFRDMSSLSSTSAVSVACDVAIVLIVSFKCMIHGATKIEPVPHVASDAQHPKGQFGDPWDFAHAAFMEAFGAMCFAFVCHHSAFLVYTSLANPTPKRYNIVCHGSIGVALVLCLTLSCTGYAKFQMDTQANVLNNFAQDDLLMAFCRFLLAMTMFFTYPMEFFVCRHAWISTVHAGWEDTNVLHYSVTVVTWGISLIIGVLCTNLGFVLELTGGFAATFLGFILPAAIYLKLEGGTIFEWETFSNGSKMGAIFLFVFGVFTMITSTGLTILKGIEGH